MRIALAFLATLQAAAIQPDVDLSALTVPTEALGSCGLAPRASEPVGAGRVRSGYWGPVAIPSNPWFGDHDETVARIGGIVVGPEGAPRLPDGPPLDAGGLADLQRQAFAGALAYAAAYRNGDDLTFVYALRSARLELGMRSGLVAQRPTDSTNNEVFRAAGVWVRILGSRGPCFHAARRHLELVLADRLRPR